LQGKGYSALQNDFEGLLFAWPEDWRQGCAKAVHFRLLETRKACHCKAKGPRRAS
jgi:hypothetical protein